MQQSGISREPANATPVAVIAVLVCCILVVAIGFGIRQSLGMFMRPITLDLGWTRESLSLVMAVQALLNGMAAPFTGALSDKWGPGRTIAVGGVIYSAGLLVMSRAVDPTQMLFGGGLLMGMGLSACGMPIILAAVGQSAPERQRSLWLGLTTAGATLGQLVIIPMVSYLLIERDWRASILALAVCAAVIVPLAIVISIGGRGRARPKSTQSLGQALTEARRHRGYQLLVAGFFVCGFQVQFVGTHLPAYIQDAGFATSVAATSLVMIAFFNFFGAATAGYLGGITSKKYLLSGIYFARAVLIAIFVTVPLTETSVLVFSAVMGLLWLGTVPLTSGLVAQIFGPRYMATLFSVVFLSHQAGNFLGAWLGGRLFDVTGSYTVVWWIAAALGLAAAFVHLPIDDQPVARLRDAPADLA